MEKVRYLDFLDPIQMIWRRGTNDDPYVDKVEILPVINQRAVLSEIPDKASRVKIQSMNEINYERYKKHFLKENEFYVDYANGIVHFHAEKESHTPSITYKGRGFILYPSSRIYHHDKETDISTTFDTIINNVSVRLKELGVAHKDLSELKQQLYDSITEANFNSDRLKIVIEQGVSAVQLIDKAFKTTQLIFQPWVETYDDLFTEYRYPQVGWVSYVRETSERYRWDGVKWTPIDILSGSVPLANEHVDGLLSSEGYKKLNGISEHVDTRVAVFSIPQLILVGTQDIHFCSLFNGEIKEIKASVSATGNGDLVIQIEKSNNYSDWEEILEDPIKIKENEYFDDGSLVINDAIIKEGDIYRLVVLEAPETYNLTVNIKFEI